VKFKLLILTALCGVAFLSGCQSVTVNIYLLPEGEEDSPGVHLADLEELGAKLSGVRVNQSMYKANAGVGNWLDQDTDASATIPASILGGPQNVRK